MTPRTIVSLTSYPGRIQGLHLTVRSLVNQTVKPDLIVLWLAESQFPNLEDDLPISLRELSSDLFQIRWCDDLRSYKKLIPALENYPDANLITVDDDCIYDSNLVSKLLEGYRVHPDCIVCSRVTKFHHRDGVLFADKGGSSYWPEPSYLNKLVGCGGCLYPPDALDSDVMDKDAFIRLAPTSDDLWFWLMAVKHGTKIYRIPQGEWLPRENMLNGEITPLSAVNDAIGGYFYKHLDSILDEYPEVYERLLSSKDTQSCSLGRREKLAAILAKVRRLPAMRTFYAAYLNNCNRKREESLYLLRRLDKLERELEKNEGAGQ